VKKRPGKAKFHQQEHGNIKAVLAILVFSMFSFVVSFAGVWIALVGLNNPFTDGTAEQTLEELARSDSLRALEMKLEQDIAAKKEFLQRLQVLVDSLESEISSRERVVKSLENEIDRLRSQLVGTEEERLKKLANIIAGLSEENLKKITENMNIDLLVSIVLNLSPRKAQTVLNAMEPRRAARVAQRMTQIKKQQAKGS